MVTTIEYALMAGASYVSTRADVNKFPAPQGWVGVKHDNPPNGSGFEAISFIPTGTVLGTSTSPGTATEIVISFAGTYDIDINGDQATNLGLGLGIGSPQLIQAAAYYLQVRKDNPDATITLTGHSLGGGLAALVGVFFGVGAQTFDQAPFALTARGGALDLLTQLSDKIDANGVRLYSNAELAPLYSYYAEQNASFNLVTPIPNEGLVSNINVSGEIVSLGSILRIGSDVNIEQGSMNVSGTNLHSQALLAAMLQSGDTPTSTAANHTLGQVTFKLTDLLAMIFDLNLYFNDPLAIVGDVKENFLERLVKHQAGIFDPVTGTATLTPDAMVTRFTSDLWKLAQDGGLTMSEGTTLLGELNNVNQALIAFAMQKYYEENNPNITYGTELFTDLSTAGEGSNGICFDMPGDSINDTQWRITA